MRLRTANQRAKRKRFGVKLRRSTVRRIALCNRFAASTEGKALVVGYRSNGYGRQPAYFPEVFYALKDRLMDRYGKPKGLALQRWTSWASDSAYDGYSRSDGAVHEHILERVKLGGLMLHRPTGHFHFWNTLNDYYKKTVGFEVIEKTCVERIEGKKEIKRNIPDRTEACAALRWLQIKFRALLAAPSQPKPRLHTITGDYESEAMERAYRAERNAEREQFAQSDVQCHWCLKAKKGAEVTRMNGHYFCAPCSVIIAKSLPL